MRWRTAGKGDFAIGGQGTNSGCRALTQIVRMPIARIAHPSLTATVILRKATSMPRRQLPKDANILQIIPSFRKKPQHDFPSLRICRVQYPKWL